MNKSLLLPLIFLKFWYIDSPLEMLKFLGSLNNYTAQLFALPLCIKTYFKPIKNEYREGLVGFSRVIGILVKTGLILTDLFILSLLLIIEIVIVVSFLAFPIITLLLLVI